VAESGCRVVSDEVLTPDNPCYILGYFMNSYSSKQTNQLKEKSHPVKIRWSPRLRPILLKRLYQSDASGFQDLDLCNEVGMYLFERCRTFYLVYRHEVECSLCGRVFLVSRNEVSPCPQDECDWYVTPEVYALSIKNYSAWTGRAIDAFISFYRRYPGAKAYKDKILLIDQLIHSFHIDEKTGNPTKSVASKLLEGNKKDVVRFLDELSAHNPNDKGKWRQIVGTTIDARVLKQHNTS
jgi:hypothetical protein